jgi:hypothetical protein
LLAGFFGMFSPVNIIAPASRHQTDEYKRYQKSNSVRFKVIMREKVLLTICSSVFALTANYQPGKENDS